MPIKRPEIAGDDPELNIKPIGSTRHLNNIQVQNLIASYEAGATVYELGERFGIERKAVSRILHHHQVPMRRRGLTTEQAGEAIHLYGIGWPLARVGKHLGVDGTTVRHKLHERGIPTRDPQGRPRT